MAKTSCLVVLDLSHEDLSFYSCTMCLTGTQVCAVLARVPNTKHQRSPSGLSFKLEDHAAEAAPRPACTPARCHAHCTHAHSRLPRTRSRYQHLQCPA